MSEAKYKIIQHLSSKDWETRGQLGQLFEQAPIPAGERMAQLPLYLTRQQISRILFLHHVYQQMIDVHGVIMEFGVRWGQQLALLQALRGIYEPYNYTRKIVGFDTFRGFVDVAPQDGKAEHVEPGAYAVSQNYEDYLAQMLATHEQESPIPHIPKWELVVGDVRATLPEYLRQNPHTIIAFAYLDLDLYEPTKFVLEAIRPYLTKGSILAFDELVHPEFPGETIALREVMGLGSYQIRRWPHHSRPSYLVIE